MINRTERSRIYSKEPIVRTRLGEGDFTLRQTRRGETVAAINGFVLNMGEPVEIVKHYAGFKPWL